MFADEANISIPGCTLADLQPLINSELVNHNNCWLRVNKFSLNVAQTEFMIVASRQRLLAAESNTEICVELENHRIERVVHTKSFSLSIDGRLSWINYIYEECKKVSAAIDALKRIRPFVSQSTAIQIYNALIQPLQNYETSSSVLVDMLKWDTLSARRQKQKAVMMFKSLHKLVPVYLQHLFNERS